jgi:hypothetical protein
MDFVLCMPSGAFHPGRCHQLHDLYSCSLRHRSLPRDDFANSKAESLPNYEPNTTAEYLEFLLPILKFLGSIRPSGNGVS